MNDGINFTVWIQYPDIFVKYIAVITVKKPADFN